ncbi:Flavin-dependent oxidoreductase, luciferase family (includes alkanesulfonate monooxygenase SsuD and methylene tetrahydromethanopterin reductase) [Amycolatopsis tolypomycina]|uniref:Flavin-dependent oxidoreductase, luciferase family (Includes alkanesulfonate monooxygenase SsuD and methylene tetrahydromethanopterin reductase) n=1 Tax=Amycolatopsis tolypomycina TaxID=208445 RepID=A0A1H4NW30_9PSEU|nr:LLM class flavin-dependent oxidoreductase [Amycolatopsis tolypomycina]SEB99411.1 Flavin-dependent oxidoreductase, luciferase family (includes alkanesulfonate monooxygenase SsuD and methylene tetrahydromethanopterin reductase) [Amycolatopsis tolypomycina]
MFQPSGVRQGGGHPGGIARYAREAERAGAGGLWVGDRLLSPVAPVVSYPGYDTMPEEFHTAYDPFTALAIAAAVTETAVLGSSTINATQYQPANFARLLTSIDVASNGRLLPGLGIGWSPDEYAAVGVPMSERGKRLDDLLDLLESWWTKDTVAHEGVGYAIAESHVALKPVRKPPIHLAGFGEKSLRRVAERRTAGSRSGRCPSSSRGRHHLDAGEAPRRRRAGRPDPQALGVALRVNAAPGTDAETIAASVTKIVELVAPDHTFVDLTYLTSSVDEHLDLTGRLLELTAKG